MHADQTGYSAAAVDFGGYEQLEFSIDRKEPFSEKTWDKLPELLDFLAQNLPASVEKALPLLVHFAAASGFFKSAATGRLAFEFVDWVQLPDNSTSYAGRWQFELVFQAQDDLDVYGRWLVAFDGSCISGIRREAW
ncbi:MAG: hypothetical protein ACRYFX_28225 [Janthinobacterium lividum]